MGAKAMMTALPIKIREQEELRLYRLYMTETSRINAENSAKLSGGDYVKAHYSELIDDGSAESRTADEIISTLKEKLEGGE